MLKVTIFKKMFDNFSYLDTFSSKKGPKFCWLVTLPFQKHHHFLFTRSLLGKSLPNFVQPEMIQLGYSTTSHAIYSMLALFSII